MQGRLKACFIGSNKTALMTQAFSLPYPGDPTQGGPRQVGVALGWYESARWAEERTDRTAGNSAKGFAGYTRCYPSPRLIRACRAFSWFCSKVNGVDPAVAQGYRGALPSG